MKGIRSFASEKYRNATLIAGGVLLVAFLLSGIQIQPDRARRVAFAQRVRRAMELRNLAYILVDYAKDHAEKLPTSIDDLTGQLFEPSPDGVFAPRGEAIGSFTASDLDPEVFSENSYIASKDGSHLLVFQRPGLSPNHLGTYIELDLKGKWKWASSDYQIKEATQQQLTGLISTLDSLPEHLSPADSLIAAAENDQINKIEALLDQGVSIDVQDRRGWTALTAAAERDQAGTVQLLLSKGAKINGKDNVGMGRTALMRACALGHTDLVEILLAHGADFQTKADDGTTALSDALPYPEIVEKLMTAGANINKHSENELSPLTAC